MKLSLCLAFVAAIPAFSASSTIRLTGGEKAENKLRRFLEQDERLRARLDDAARREEAFLAESRESDLRDAVSSLSLDNLHVGMGLERNERRKQLLAAFPGMQAASEPACRTIADCLAPDLAVEVLDAGSLPETLRRMVRPWMVLQQARGSGIELASADGPGDAALTMRLKDLDAQPLVLSVAPRLLGGFKVWFDRPFVLAALYERERTAALRSGR